MAGKRRKNITPSQRRETQRLYEDGESVKGIAKQMRLSPSSIYKIIRLEEKGEPNLASLLLPALLRDHNQGLIDEVKRLKNFVLTEPTTSLRLTMPMEIKQHQSLLQHTKESDLNSRVDAHENAAANHRHGKNDAARQLAAEEEKLTPEGPPRGLSKTRTTRILEHVENQLQKRQLVTPGGIYPDRRLILDDGPVPPPEYLQKMWAFTESLLLPDLKDAWDQLHSSSDHLVDALDDILLTGTVPGRCEWCPG